MGLALAALAWWYAALVPLRLWQARAQARYDRAAATWLAVRDTSAALRELSAGHPRDPAALAASALGAAEAAGIAVSRQRQDEHGRLALEVDAVDAPALLGWLDLLQREHGIAVERLRVEKRDGRLRVAVSVRTEALR